MSSAVGRKASKQKIYADKIRPGGRPFHIGKRVTCPFSCLTSKHVKKDQIYILRRGCVVWKGGGICQNPVFKSCRSIILEFKDVLTLQYQAQSILHGYIPRFPPAG